MKRIISSQLYQLSCSFSLIHIWLIMAAAMAGLGIVNCATSEHARNAGAMIIEGDGILWMFQLMFMGVMVGTICAGDFKEKDLNYELMSGHTRLSIYAGRVILSVLITALASTLLSFMPVVSAAMVFGWGDTLDPFYMAVRIALLFFPFMRYAAFFSMLAFVIKKRWVIIVLGYISIVFCIIVSDIVTNKTAFITSVFNIMKLTDIESFSLYNVVPNLGVVSYSACDSSIGFELAVGTVAVSLVMTLVYLTAGYGFFRRDDLE